jgi:hypothetical protein
MRWNYVYIYIIEPKVNIAEIHFLPCGFLWHLQLQTTKIFSPSLSTYCTLHSWQVFVGHFVGFNILLYPADADKYKQSICIMLLGAVGVVFDFLSLYRMSYSDQMWLVVGMCF